MRAGPEPGGDPPAQPRRAAAVRARARRRPRGPSSPPSSGLNRSTIGALTADLAAAGLVSEEAPRETGRAGRPSLVVRPESDRVYAYAFSIEVDRVRAARVGLGGVVLDRREIDRARAADRPPTGGRRRWPSSSARCARHVPADAVCIGSAARGLRHRPPRGRPGPPRRPHRLGRRAARRRARRGAGRRRHVPIAVRQRRRPRRAGRAHPGRRRRLRQRHLPARRRRRRRRHHRRRPAGHRARRLRRRGRPHGGQPAGPAVQLRLARLLGDRDRRARAAPRRPAATAPAATAVAGGRRRGRPRRRDGPGGAAPGRRLARLRRGQPGQHLQPRDGHLRRHAARRLPRLGRPGPQPAQPRSRCRPAASTSGCAPRPSATTPPCSARPSSPSNGCWPTRSTSPPATPRTCSTPVRCSPPGSCRRSSESTSHWTSHWTSRWTRQSTTAPTSTASPVCPVRQDRSAGSRQIGHLAGALRAGEKVTAGGAGQTRSSGMVPSNPVRPRRRPRSTRSAHSRVGVATPRPPGPIGGMNRGLRQLDQHTTGREVADRQVHVRLARCSSPPVVTMRLSPTCSDRLVADHREHLARSVGRARRAHAGTKHSRPPHVVRVVPRAVLGLSGPGWRDRLPQSLTRGPAVRREHQLWPSRPRRGRAARSLLTIRALPTSAPLDPRPPGRRRHRRGACPS